MPIQEHPAPGTILMCNFDQGFRQPEMIKRRAVVVVSPRISVRPGLCTVVPLSTTTPQPEMPYHCRLRINPPLPPPFDGDWKWVKGDMICAVGFHRLDLVRLAKGPDGRRRYRRDRLNPEDMRRIRACVLAALGLGGLTKHLP